MTSRWPGGKAESEKRVQRVAAISPGSLVHVAGICGTGMAAVASLLKQLGYRIQGSDKAFYPPMGEVVRGLTDQIFEGYKRENLDSKPDFVVIGNNLRSDNPEVLRVLEENIPYASMPEVFSALLIGRRDFCPNSIVVTGTHGKTTTSAAVATLLEKAGLRPGFFVGGVPKDLPGGIRAVNTAVLLHQRAVVLEGDEYDSAFFAKWPKFHSYRPDLLIVTSLEFDHADIYNSVEEIEEEFLQLVRAVPESGEIFVCAETERLRKLAEMWRSETPARVSLYGFRAGLPFSIRERVPHGSGQRVTYSLDGKSLQAELSLSGEHNALNLLAAAAVVQRLGISVQTLQDTLPLFHGVLRRQHIVAERNGVTLIEDFAHHPTAIAVTLAGLRESYPESRLVAVYEPRSNTARRNFFQEEYPASFAAADMTILLEVQEKSGYSNTDAAVVPLDVSKIIAQIAANGRSAVALPTVDKIESYLGSSIQSGDVIVCMSNGDFGGLIPRLKRLIEAH